MYNTGNAQKETDSKPSDGIQCKPLFEPDMYRLDRRGELVGREESRFLAYWPVHVLDVSLKSTLRMCGSRRDRAEISHIGRTTIFL